MGANRYSGNKVKLLVNDLVSTHCTIRELAKKYDMSKTMVHNYVTKGAILYCPALYFEVKAILYKNKMEGPMRGGMATKRKYEEVAKKSR